MFNFCGDAGPCLCWGFIFVSQHELLGHSSACRTPHCYTDCSTKMQFLEENDHSFPFSRTHEHKHLLILTFKLELCTGTLIQKRICKSQNHSPQRAHLLTHLSLCFVKGSHFTFLQLHHLPFHFPVAIHTCQWQSLKPFAVDTSQTFQLTLVFQIVFQLELHLNPCSFYNITA